MTENETNTKKEDFKLGLFTMSFEVGYTIAVPLILLALGGRLLDKNLDTAPLFILLGIVLALIISSWSVYKKVKKLM